MPHTSGGDGGGNGGSDGGDGGNGGSATLTLIDLRATAAGESIAIAGGAPVPESASSVDTAAWNGGSPANGSAFGCSTAACAPSADEAAVSFAEEGSPAGRAAAAASAHASAASRLGGGIECGPSEMLQRGGGANSGKARRRRHGEERNASPLAKVGLCRRNSQTRVLSRLRIASAAARGALRAISAHTTPRRVGRRAK